MINLDSLDYLLRRALAHLADNWFEPGVGIVAASLRTTSGSVLLATSRVVRPGIYAHAESELLEAFDKQKGSQEGVAGSVMAVTLSPCISPSRSRDGLSCATLIENAGIKIAHVGVVDKKQGGVNAYDAFNFALSQSHDYRLQRNCRDLLELFSRFGQTLNNDIETVKSELGHGFYARIFNDCR